MHSNEISFIDEKGINATEHQLLNKAINILHLTEGNYGTVVSPRTNQVIGRATRLSDTEWSAVRNNAFNDDVSHVELRNGYKKRAKYNLPITAEFTDRGVSVMPNRAKALNNSLTRNNTNITPNLGVLQAIDTLTYVKQEVIQQKFYEVDLTKYFPISMGEAGFQRQISQYTQYEMSDMTDFNNFTLTGTTGVQRPKTDIGLSTINLPTLYFINKIDYTVIEVQEMAAGRVPFSAIQLKEGASAKKFVLSHQNLLLNDGAFNNTGVLGLGNLNLTPGANVFTNTTLIPTFIYQMNPTAYQTFVSEVLYSYRLNSANTEYPDTFVIPEAEYFALFSTFVNPNFPMLKMGADLLETFKSTTKNPNFQILPNAYFDAPKNAENRHKYALYRNAPDVLEAYNPVPYQSTAFQSMNGFEFESVNFAQVTGLLLKRDRAFMYFNHS